MKAIDKPKWLIKHDKIQYDPVEDRIAAGNFGSVYKGSFIKDNGEAVKVALKVCHQEAGEADQTKAVEARIAMMHEARLMSEYKFEK